MWNLELYNWYCSSDTLKGYFASQNLVDAALLSNYLLKYDWIIYKSEGILCSTERTGYVWHNIFHAFSQTDFWYLLLVGKKNKKKLQITL